MFILPLRFTSKVEVKREQGAGLLGPTALSAPHCNFTQPQQKYLFLMKYTYFKDVLFRSLNVHLSSLFLARIGLSIIRELDFCVRVLCMREH